MLTVVVFFIVAAILFPVLLIVGSLLESLNEDEYGGNSDYTAAGHRNTRSADGSYYGGQNSYEPPHDTTPKTQFQQYQNQPQVNQIQHQNPTETQTHQYRSQHQQNETLYQQPRTQPEQHQTQSHQPYQTQSQQSQPKPNERNTQQRGSRPPSRGGIDERNGATTPFRSPTPNHYRSNTPSLPTPETPPNRQETTRQNENQQQQNRASAGADDEQTKMFRTFNELSDAEKKMMVDVSECRIFVMLSLLEPIVELIKRSGGGQSPQYLIAYFDQENDKNLSPYEKIVRKSFKVKDDRNNLARFARLLIKSNDPVYYTMSLHDYTPYMEVLSPKFDPSRFEFTKERSRWETVSASMFHRSKRINVETLKVLVPAKS